MNHESDTPVLILKDLWCEDVVGQMKNRFSSWWGGTVWDNQGTFAGEILHAGTRNARNEVFANYPQTCLQNCDLVIVSPNLIITLSTA